ncbi:hypothetical protein CJD36_019150 [Flavipsychrobacter stenotrophus]|uniref:DUF4396 domain-containing protein n=1 Tax=Flavipsychrobacter stenotrophus TaxID=2077091 RepID=A0A2S7SS42_9BACT|nr:hypothetical protein CJD36_019150 [Flavipsychrobacter stenotrophus]
MIWTEIGIWKRCLISTFICLIGCSIGVMGVMFYLVNYPWLVVLLLSFICGLITCLLFMIGWDMLFNKMNFIASFRMSYKMSIISLSIMILSENAAMRLIAPISSTDQMHMHSNHNLQIMAIAMVIGFLLSLPYNYYILQKNDQVCH